MPGIVFDRKESRESHVPPKLPFTVMNFQKKRLITLPVISKCRLRNIGPKLELRVTLLWLLAVALFSYAID